MKTMAPYASDAQRKYFNANKAQLEKQGVDVDEWNQASKGMKLPSKKPKKAATGMGNGMGVSSRVKQY